MCCARVGKSRVLLELVIRKFKAGATPEAIVQSFDTLNLSDVYAFVSRYLSDPSPFEEYLTIRDEAGEAMRNKIEELQGPQGNLRPCDPALPKESSPGAEPVLKMVSDKNFD